MGKDFISSNDAEFDQQAKQFGAAITTNPGKYGLTPADVSAFQGAQATWNVDYPAHIKAQEDAETATSHKEVARTGLEGVMRGLAAKVRGTPGMNDGLLAAAGLPVHSHTRTAIAAPATWPVGRIEARGHATLVLHFNDNETPKRDAKPHGVHGCEIHTYVGDAAPADEASYRFLAIDTRTPYVDEHPPADAGKTAYYRIRWQNAKGEAGPWGDVVSAIIPR